MFMFRQLFTTAKGVDGCTDRYVASLSVIWHRGGSTCQHHKASIMLRSTGSVTSTKQGFKSRFIWVWSHSNKTCHRNPSSGALSEKKVYCELFKCNIKLWVCFSYNVPLYSLGSEIKKKLYPLFWLYVSIQVCYLLSFFIVFYATTPVFVHAKYLWICSIQLSFRFWIGFVWLVAGNCFLIYQGMVPVDKLL